MTKSSNSPSSNKNRAVVTKLERSVRKALASASSNAKDVAELDRFSYQVDWSNFPNSLMVNCHLSEQFQPENLTQLEENLIKIVQLSLLKQGIKFRDFRKNITLIMAQ
jgi:hypothetical protein